MSGALYYRQYLVESLQSSDVSCDEQIISRNKPYANWEMSSGVRWLGTFVTTFIVLFCMAYTAWRSSSLSLDASMKILQMVFLSLLIDVFIVSTVLALLCSYVTISIIHPPYLDIFWKFTNYLHNIRRKKKMLDEEENDELLVRQMYDIRKRARFIRYAEPYSLHDLRRKRHKNKKNLISTKIFREVILSLALLGIAIFIFDDQIKEVSMVQRTFRETKDKTTETATIESFWEFIDNKMKPMLNNTFCNRLELFDGVLHTNNEPVLMNPLLIKRSVDDVEEVAVIKCGRYNPSFEEILASLKENNWVNESAGRMTVSYNVMNKLNGYTIYSLVEVEYMQIKGNHYSRRNSCRSLHYEMRCIYDGNTILNFFVRLLLLLVVIKMCSKYYLRVLQHGYRKALLHFKHIVTVTIWLLSSVLLVICLIHCVFSNDFETALNAQLIEQDADGIFNQLDRLYQLNEFTRHVKGLLIFAIAIKCMFLLKLHPTTLTLLQMMRDATKGLAIYFIYIWVLIFGFSHLWMMLFHQESKEFVNFLTSLRYVILHIPWLATDLDISSLSSMQLTFVIICSLAVYLAVRMSCIYFVGVYGKSKIQKNKIFTLWLVLKNRWMCYKNKFKKMREMLREYTPREAQGGKLMQLFTGKRRRKSTYKSKVPKKYIYDEINYQSEEMLYRINKLAQIDEDDFDKQIREIFFKFNTQLKVVSECTASIKNDFIFDSETESSSSYFADLSQTSHASSHIEAGNFRKVSHNSSLFDTFQSNKPLCGRSVRVQEGEMRRMFYPEDEVRRRSYPQLPPTKILEEPTFSHPAFKRFNLSQINETVINSCKPDVLFMERNQQNANQIYNNACKKPFQRPVLIKAEVNENKEIEETRRKIDYIKQKSPLSPEEADALLRAVAAESQQSANSLNISDSGLGSSDHFPFNQSKDYPEKNTFDSRIKGDNVRNMSMILPKETQVDVIEQRQKEFRELLDHICSQKESHLYNDDATF